MFTNDKFTEEKENWIERKTIIGNNVRIGSNATILPVTIGDGAVIGAGAVVTKSCPPYSIIGGTPAKVLKFRFTIDEILKQKEITVCHKINISIEKDYIWIAPKLTITMDKNFKERCRLLKIPQNIRAYLYLKNINLEELIFQKSF